MDSSVQLTDRSQQFRRRRLSMCNDFNFSAFLTKNKKQKKKIFCLLRICIIVYKSHRLFSYYYSVQLHEKALQNFTFVFRGRKLNGFENMRECKWCQNIYFWLNYFFEVKSLSPLITDSKLPLKTILWTWTHEPNTQQKCHLWICQHLTIRLLRKDVKNINSSDLTDINIYIYNSKHSVSVSVLAYWKIACAVFNCMHESRLNAKRFSSEKQPAS